MKEIPGSCHFLTALHLSFSLIPFSFIFEIQQSVQVILIVSFVSSGVQKRVDNSRLQGTGYSYIFFCTVFGISSPEFFKLGMALQISSWLTDVLQLNMPDFDH